MNRRRVYEKPHSWGTLYYFDSFADQAKKISEIKNPHWEIGYEFEKAVDAHKQEVPVLALSNEGQRLLLAKQDIFALRKKIRRNTYITHGMKPVGEGSEGDTYKISLLGTEIAYKVFNPITDKKIKETLFLFRSGSFRPYFHEKFGYLETLTNFLNSLQIPGVIFVTPVELAATHDVSLRVWVEGVCLDNPELSKKRSTINLQKDLEAVSKMCSLVKKYTEHLDQLYPHNLMLEFELRDMVMISTEDGVMSVCVFDPLGSPIRSYDNPSDGELLNEFRANYVAACRRPIVCNAIKQYMPEAPTKLPWDK